MVQNIGRLIKIASNELTREFDEFARPYGITSGQMSIIDYLSRSEKDEVLQKEIERDFNIQRSTATVLLQRMEKAGLIKRESSQQDSRQKKVILQPAATELETDILLYMSKKQDMISALFTTEQMESLEFTLLSIINQNKKEAIIFE